MTSSMDFHEPPADCDRCPRLVAFRREMQAANPDWHNAPVASFGPESAKLLIVGLAPGMKGANRTGRPFTGDYAGDLLYPTLLQFGFASGGYGRDPDDGLALRDCRIANAVRCLPPQNKPIGQEMKNCRDFLAAEIHTLPKLQSILALGRVAHENILSALALRRADYKFGHGARYQVTSKLQLFSSYHCSRYNTNTGRLTEAMFHDVFRAIAATF